ncbi:MAG TPA: hypothetical protein VEB01_11980 [Methylocaldum sp.]|nr:hypothetical protein [Methylocaldum sp.]HYE36117.1 hypothetical protein [Methylocaldum sp.]
MPSTPVPTERGEKMKPRANSMLTATAMPSKRSKGGKLTASLGRFRRSQF